MSFGIRLLIFILSCIDSTIFFWIELEMDVETDNEVCEYERMRQQNIIENHDFMVKCGKSV